MNTIEYICRRCTKTVPDEQYKRSQFCPICGTKMDLKPLPKHWLFQFNPSAHTWPTHAEDMKEPKQWLVSHLARLISEGDFVAVWGAGHNGGIFALGQIVSKPAISPLNANQQKDFPKPAVADKFTEKPSVYVEYFKMSIEKPLLPQDVCSRDRVLAELQVFLNPQGTNFRLRPEQWDRILELIDN